MISIHAPREGGDKIGRHKPTVPDTFQSTPPARGATDLAALRPGNVRFQSTPPARGATSNANLMGNPIFLISIHAPREGGDKIGRHKPTVPDTFQSTPPARGATDLAALRPGNVRFQSTPPARGATSNANLMGNPIFLISIHAPREGGDYVFAASNKTAAISIHAPREGGDCTGRYIARPCRHFNPRPPRGGRQLEIVYPAAETIFQSTPPARGATNGHGSIPQAILISIHAPREGGDGACGNGWS